MTTNVETVLFLPGLGAGVDPWDAQLLALPAGLTGLAPEIPGLDRAATPGEFTLAGAADALRDLLDERGHPWNRQFPELFSRTIGDFYTGLSTRA